MTMAKTKDFVPWLLRQHARLDDVGCLASDLRQEPDARLCASPGALLEWCATAWPFSRIADVLEHAWVEFLGDPRAMLTYDAPEKDCWFCEESVAHVMPQALIFEWETWPEFSWASATPSYCHESCFKAGVVTQRAYSEQAQRRCAEKLNNILSGITAKYWKRFFPQGFYQVLKQDWQEDKVSLRPFLDSSAAGSVYILHAEGTNRVKIGRSVATSQRFANLHTASPYPLQLLREIITADAVALERDLHRQYAKYRRHREWFEFPPDILQTLLVADFAEWETKAAPMPRSNHRSNPSLHGVGVLLPRGFVPEEPAS